MSDEPSIGTISIDATTRILRLSELRLKIGKALEPVDVRGGAILLLDDDGRPVATLRKIPGVKAPAPPTEPEPGERTEGGGTGRLSDAQRDDLLGLVRAHPRLDAARIGEMFERKSGRSLSVLTVQKYVDQVRGG